MSSPDIAGLAERIARLPREAREALAEQLRDEGRFDAPRAGRLVGYYVTRPDDAVAPGDLRAHLADHLPAHMIPAVLVPMETMPRTPHGKVDRSALPDPKPATRGTGPESTAGEPVAPSDLERELVALWGSVLGTDLVGPDDSFFEIGGDSLLGIQLLGRVRERWQIDLPMAALFDHPTPRATAKYIEAILWARGSEAPSDADIREEIEF